MTPLRSYEDPCGIARALDVVGDRWALLVVRELLFGPRRFVQLRAGLHGVSPNVLSQRLRELEHSGIVRRDVLDQPASVAIYELTARGRDLEPILLALGSWGSAEPVTNANELSVNALMLALKTVFDSAADVAAEYALRVDGRWFAVTIAGGSIDITAVRFDKAAVTLETDVATLRSVAFGRESISRAEQDGRLTVRGDRDLAERFTTMFQVPDQLRR